MQKKSLPEINPQKILFLPNRINQSPSLTFYSPIYSALPQGFPFVAH